MPLPKTTQHNTTILQSLHLALSASILGVSAHICQIHHSQHATNPWWLPVWQSHFSNLGLVGVITCSTLCLVSSLACLLVVNVFFLGQKHVSSRGGVNKEKAKTWIVALSSLLGFSASLIAVVLPAVANSRDPNASDTVQTWTCRWKDVDGSPENFGSLCSESRFTSYATIPLLVINVFLLAQSIQDVIAFSKTSSFSSRGVESDGEEELVRITKGVAVVGDGDGGRQDSFGVHGGGVAEKGIGGTRSVEV